MTVDTKICATCGKRKIKSEYHKRSDRKCGVHSSCKKCTSEYKKNRYWMNHTVELAKMTKSRLKPENQIQRKEYYLKNKKAYVSRYKKYMSDPKKVKRMKERGASYWLKTKKNPTIIAKRWAYHRDPANIAKRKEAHHKRKKVDENYNIKRRLRTRLRHITRLTGTPKFMSATSLVGCSFSDLKAHIERQFTKGMTWNKLNLGEIHIDHIIPCASFDLTKLSQQKKCFRYSNLQPLWRLHNLSKGAKLNYVY